MRKPRNKHNSGKRKFESGGGEEREKGREKIGRYKQGREKERETTKGPLSQVLWISLHDFYHFTFIKWRAMVLRQCLFTKTNKTNYQQMALSGDIS